jgi:CRISPR/Cas system-associated exonuclease Cas4 (RecB family)
MALRREWERERGIKPPPTKEEKANLEAGRRYIFEAQMRAHNRKIEAERLRAERQGIKLVENKIPVREVANG